MTEDDIYKTHFVIVPYLIPQPQRLNGIVRAVFRDRDGVINGLCYHQELEIRYAPFTVNQFQLIPRVTDAINMLHRSGYRVILISNGLNSRT